MKTIIITGANGNLGVATVKKFLGEGYKVIAVDSNSKHLDFAINNLDFEFHSVNLTDEQETTEFIQGIILKHGAIDGAVMLVGGFMAGKVEATTGDDLDKMFSLNFKTAFYVSRSLLTHMRNRKNGRLVFIGARPALSADQGKDMAAYALAKSLLFKLADFINEEVKGDNITASVIVPSTIDTEINRKFMPDANYLNWVKPSQLADIIELVISEEGSPLRDTVLKVYNNA